MGFSSALQGRAAHEALIVRQDAELRLMETMKRSIQMKAKFDKEYAVSLAAVAQQGLKIDRADELQGSIITKSWRSYMDELDQQAKQFKANAELLEVVCEKISHLSQDKRKARKTYQEEHTRIAARLNHLTDEVVRKKAEYQKHLEGYKALRTRFEEHYVKSGRSGRKLDDVRDKYQKACRKLHLTHNEYVLTIAEAIEVEKDFRTILLPGLLEHQQSVQESFILLWKNILQDASQHSDLTSDKFKEIQRRIETVINNINPSEEYREFTEKHKTSPTAPVVFQFDDSLIEDTPGKLQSNSLTVDNLTVDWLRSRLNELESSVKECQEKQEKMVCDVNGSGSPLSNGTNGIGKDSTQKQSKDLNSMRCQEKQKQKLADIIKTALSEVGCEELPSGCDDHLTVEQNFIENNCNTEQPGTTNNSANSVTTILQKGADMVSMIRAPFKRKSTPQSQTPKPKPRIRGNSQPRSQSLGSLSVNSYSDSKCSIVEEPPNDSVENLSSSVSCVNEPTNASSSITNLNKTDDDDCNNDIEEQEKQKYSTNENIQIVPTMTTSIDVHLDNIDKINQNLDEKLKQNFAETELLVAELNEDGLEIKNIDNITKDSRSEINVEVDQIEQKVDSLTNTISIGVQCIDFAEDKQESIKNSGEDSPPKSDSNKRSTSFSQKSINSFLYNLKEFKFSKHSSQKINKNCGHNDSPARTTASAGDVSEESNSDINGSLSKIETSKKCKKTESKVKVKKISSKLKSNSSIDGQKSKPNRTMRETFRTKLLSFQTRKTKICDKCTKRRKIHPSKSVADFGKEFNTAELFEKEFCVCANELCESANDNSICIKEHFYCEPFGMSFSPNRPLYEEEWFHGVLPREEVVRLLKVEGDFLVRETIRNEESQIVLSVCWNGHKHFIVQTTADGHYRFEGPPFPSIQELIMHQYQSELPVTVKSGAILRRPVMRERWELSNDDVILLEKIGRGNFGDVYKAKLKSTKQDVAVKTCRMTLPDEQKRKFLQEGRILKQYDNTNIVKLIGICVQKQPIMIVMELVPGGSLLNFLRKNSNTLAARQLMGMCRDAAAGMRYLESKNCIHRDLAARNCLIDYENSVKISDFGMSREEEEYIVSDGMKQIPVKWTAPEALNFGKYTSLCDVWSYGILMWEIFSKGDTPYSGMSNSRARERIDGGYRMPAPENTPPEMYRLMLKCWAAEPDSRPHFDEIYTVVDALLTHQDS